VGVRKRVCATHTPASVYNNTRCMAWSKYASLLGYPEAETPSIGAYRLEFRGIGGISD
jgi:hypothetical protein